MTEKEKCDYETYRDFANDNILKADEEFTPAYARDVVLRAAEIQAQLATAAAIHELSTALSRARIFVDKSSDTRPRRRWPWLGR